MPRKLKIKVRYKYPPADRRIVCNIAKTCLDNPKFYYQVCHLMNKMNLRPPFLPFQDNCQFDDQLEEMMNQILDDLPQNEDKTNNDGDDDEEEESEIEYDGNYVVTGDEDNCGSSGNGRKVFKRQRKKLKVGILGEIRKKPKKSYIYEGITSSTSIESDHQHEEQEEQESSLTQSTIPLEPVSIRINIHSEILPSLTQDKEGSILSQEINSDHHHEESINLVSQGFGLITPKVSKGLVNDGDTVDDEIIEDESWINCLATDEEINNNRLSAKEMTISVPAYKNYSPGSPSCRLYLKNLSKKITEHQLKCIYGRYIDLDNQNDRNMFHVQLFKSGRFRNQAFISLPNETSATLALNETNGYLFDGKPLIVAFARSTKN